MCILSTAGLFFFPNVFSSWLVECEDVDTTDRFFPQPVIRAFITLQTGGTWDTVHRTKGLWSCYFSIDKRCLGVGAGRDRLAEDIVFSQEKDLFVGCDYGCGQGEYEWQRLVPSFCWRPLLPPSFLTCPPRYVVRVMEGPVVTYCCSGLFTTWHFSEIRFCTRSIPLLLWWLHTLSLCGRVTVHSPVHQLYRESPGFATQMGKSMAIDSCISTFSHESYSLLLVETCVSPPQPAPHEIEPGCGFSSLISFLFVCVYVHFCVCTRVCVEARGQPWVSFLRCCPHLSFGNSVSQ